MMTRMTMLNNTEITVIQFQRYLDWDTDGDGSHGDSDDDDDDG